MSTARLALAFAIAGCSAPPPTPEEARAGRMACKYQSGAHALETLGAGALHGNAIPIDHVVLVMQENRSFDHYFSQLSHDGVDVAAADITNPDANGVPVSRFHMKEYCFSDTNHSWVGTHQEIDDGKMDGFVVANDPNGTRAMGYYDETDIGYYYALARAFTISDRHFCSAPGETAPNREFYAAASPRGAVSQYVLPELKDAQGHALPNIHDLLDKAGVDWRFYSPGATPQLGSLVATSAGLISRDQTHLHPLDDFYADAKAGTLPPVSWVDEAVRDVTGSNEHPSASAQDGERFIAGVVKALTMSPQWPSTALFITWDEHGGLYDHVPPPPACVPDDFPLNDKDEFARPVPVVGAFDRYGIRVPLLLVSPYARRGRVSHQITDHTSLLRFLEARFDLPALTRRDANAEPPFEMFDFAHPDTSVPMLPDVVISPPNEHGC
jgi:phospholipase C